MKSTATDKTEIKTLSKPGTLLKCSIFLFILSISMCLLEDVDLKPILNSMLSF